MKGLEEAKTIRIGRQAGSTRYYPYDVSDTEYDLLPYIRHNVTRELLLFILEHDLCTFNEIVDATGNFPSATSLHLKRLKNAGIINIHYGERHQLYQISNMEAVTSVLAKYRASFVDKAVDNYVKFVSDL